jgi:hypothetical protein
MPNPIDYLLSDDYDDELEQDAVDDASASQGDSGPTALDLLLKRFDDIENRLNTAPQESEDIVYREDPNYGFDPQRIVQESRNQGAEAGTKGYLTLRKAEADLRKEFGDVLGESQIEEIVATLSSMSHDALVDTVSNRQGHIAMAYAHVGAAYKQGKLKSGGSPKATPVGGDAPRSGDPAMSALEEFEKMYGKVKSKSQRERIVDIARGR